MTWSTMARTPTPVSAYTVDLPDGTERVRLSVSLAFADLEVPDAVMLGRYLIAKGDEE